MQATIDRIAKELAPFYPESEIRAFTRLILESVCGLSFTQIALKKFRRISGGESEHINRILESLKQSEPIQYVLGEAGFCGLKFMVNPSVLIPRQETEELVDWVLKSGINRESRILDIGTGSGCIAISLKKQNPGFDVFAIDISSEAIDMAKKNARLNDVQVNFSRADILNPVGFEAGGFDVIASNPPYVRESEKTMMGKNVLLYEPETALFVPDSDPLKFYRAIAAFAGKNLARGGFLFFEINEALGEEVAALLSEKFCNIESRKDLNGKDRMVKARKP
jgi:release factor glutamine methyltransferase